MNTPVAPHKHRRIRFVIAAALLLPIVIIAIYFWSPLSLWAPAIFGPNPAEELAIPLEKALIEAGAMKKCDSGSSGLGPDNYAPNYVGRFELNNSKDDAIALLHRIAKDNGYALTHTDTSYESIEWFSDNSSKEHNFAGIQSGKIRLGVNTHNGTDKPLTCNGQVLVSNDSRTAISLSISLPARVGH